MNVFIEMNYSKMAAAVLGIGKSDVTNRLQIDTDQDQSLLYDWIYAHWDPETKTNDVKTLFLKYMKKI